MRKILIAALVLVGTSALTVASGISPTPEFVVFFDPGSARITIRGFTIQSFMNTSAAPAFFRGVFRHDGNNVWVQVDGHVDDPESRRPSNLDLRRAQAVAAELVRHGIDPARIVVVAHGAERPIIPHADGRADPANRYVEVRLCTRGTPGCRPP